METELPSLPVVLVALLNKTKKVAKCVYKQVNNATSLVKKQITSFSGCNDLLASLSFKIWLFQASKTASFLVVTNSRVSQRSKMLKLVVFSK